MDATIQFSFRGFFFFFLSVFLFWDVVDKSFRNPLEESPDAAGQRWESRCAPVSPRCQSRTPRRPLMVFYGRFGRFCRCCCRADERRRTRAQPTQPRMRALAPPACDARRSVLPSKLVALATLSPDLNMVLFSPCYNKLCRVAPSDDSRFMRCQSRKQVLIRSFNRTTCRSPSSTAGGCGKK